MTTQQLVKNRWLNALVVILIVGLVVSLFPQHGDVARGAYTTSTTDVDGNTHLASNTVNDAFYYDTTQDSNPATQQQLGIDPNWKNGVVRKSYALQYDGSNDYASGALNLSDTATITISFWLYWNAFANDDDLALEFTGNCNTTTGSFQVDPNNSGGTFSFAICEGDSTNYNIATFTRPSAGAWHHYAAVLDRSRSSNEVVAVYVDGVSQSLTYTFNNNTTGNFANSTLYAMSRAGSSLFGAGKMDELKITNGIEYTANFAPPWREKENVNTRGLWHFDEGEASTAFDSSQYSKDLTLAASTANPTWVTGANAIMDGFESQGSGVRGQGLGNQSGAGNIALGETSSTTNDKTYEMRVTGSSALSVDGINDFATFPDSDVLDFDTGQDFTVEFWVKDGTGNASEDAVVEKFAGTGGYPYVFRLTTSASSVYMGRYDGTNNPFVAGVKVINDGIWHHVAGQKSGSNLKLFIDGQLQATATDTTTATTTNTSLIYLGSRGGSSQFYNGTIDEMRISNAARYTTNFTPQRRNAIDGTTVGQWHIDEGTGQSIADSSGTGANGTLGADSGSAADDPSWVEGLASSDGQVEGAGNNSSTPWALIGYEQRQRLQVSTTTAVNAGHGVETTINRGTIMDNKQSRADGKDWRVVHQPSDKYRSLSFDGSSDYIKAIGPNSLTTITAEMWVKRGAVGGGQYGMLDFTTFVIAFDADKVDVIIPSVSNNYSTSTITDTASWHHIAVTAVSGTVKIYIDGLLDATVTPTFAAASLIAIGRRETGSTQYFNGSMDEVRVSSSIRYNGNFTPARTPYLSDSNTVGLWHFDEGSGQIVADSSTNLNNATLGADSGSSTDDPTWLTGTTADGAVSTIQEIPRFIPHGHVLGFDGSGDYVKNNNQMVASGAFTMELWFKPTNLSSNYTLVAQGTAASASNIELRTTSSGFLQATVNAASTTITGSTAITANTWNHAALVHNPNLTPKTRLYLNGTLQGTESATATYTGDNITVAGTALTVPTQTFNGLIDEVRVSTATRYRDNFSTSINPFAKDADTKLLWHEDDGSGSTLADSSGNGFGGTITNAIWLTNAGKVDSINQTQFKLVGPVGASTTDKNYYLYYGNLNESSSAQSYDAYRLTFGGDNDYVDAASPSNLDITGTLTIAAWVYPTIDTLSAVVDMAQEGLSIENYSLLIGPGTSSPKMYFQYYNAGFQNHNIDNFYTLNAWQQVVVTYSSGTITVYKNGSQQDQVSGKPALVSDTSNVFKIGRYQVGSQGYFTGSLDDVRVYSRALNSTEVSALYSNTPAVSNSGLVSHWKFDNTTAAGTSAVDSADSNTGTLSGFSFAAGANWEANINLLKVATEPAQSSLVTEQETPIFYQWRQAAGSWSTRAQIPITEAQLGSEGVYVTFNPSGVYSRQDYYRINSWAVEALSVGGIAPRGKKNAFPNKVNIILGSGASTSMTIIDAETNLVWMRFFSGSGNIMLTSSVPRAVVAKNGRLYYDASTFIAEIQFDMDDSQAYHISGNTSYSSNIADRSDGSTYGSFTGHSIVTSPMPDVSVMVNGTKQYLAVATGGGMSVIQNITQYDPNSTSPNGSAIYDYAQTVNDGYNDVVLTAGGELYGSNSIDLTLDRYDNVHSDTADQVGSADVTYSTASTPFISNGTINDISVTEATSDAQAASNTVALANNVGVDIIHEHSTQASGFVHRYVREGTLGSSQWTSKQFAAAAKFDGTNDYINVGALTGGTSVKTVEFWINPTSTTTEMVDLNGSAYINASSGTISATGFTSPTIYVDGVVTSTITANQWQHVAVVTDTGLNASAFAIGKRSTSYATGLIDEVRVSTTARYSATFTPSATPFTSDASTAGLWRLNEQVNQTVSDGSSNSNNGTLGATSAVASDDPLQVGPAIGGSADIATAVGVTGQTDYAWVGTDGASANDGAITAIGLATSKQLTSYTTSNSGLPDNDISSLSLGTGGLALVGTADGGAWNPGLAGIVIDDTAASPATTNSPVRAKSGTVRVKGGTVRVKPN